MDGEEPKLQTGAYITDGVDLFEVRAIRRDPPAIRRSVRLGPALNDLAASSIVVENCRSFRRFEFLPDKIRRRFRLVRAAPSPHCPDRVEDIVWS